jgi:hypothetical protein
VIESGIYVRSYTWQRVLAPQHTHFRTITIACSIIVEVRCLLNRDSRRVDGQGNDRHARPPPASVWHTYAMIVRRVERPCRLRIRIGQHGPKTPEKTDYETQRARFSRTTWPLFRRNRPFVRALRTPTFRNDRCEGQRTPGMEPKRTETSRRCGPIRWSTAGRWRATSPRRRSILSSVRPGRSSPSSSTRASRTPTTPRCPRPSSRANRASVRMAMRSWIIQPCL